MNTRHFYHPFRSGIRYNTDMSRVISIKSVVASLAAALLAHAAAAREPITILVPEDPRAVLESAVDDLEDTLQRMTDRPVRRETELQDGSDAAIRLVRLDEHEADHTPLAGRNVEAFHIHGEAGVGVVISGRTDAALAYGVYDYLRALGVRWLLPGDAWTIVPERDAFVIDLDVMREPTILTRRFFCNGGFGGRLGIDPDMTVQTAWQDWMRRQNFGGPQRIGGHAGEGFNLAHKETLEAHPEMLAEIDGERQPFALTTKHCLSNESLVALFVEDRLKKMQTRVERDPDSPASFAVSVDPADGGGHCTCESCLAMGSVSDRVFGLANRVARAVAEAFPGRYVSLLAYNRHAEVPTFQLEPNVYVMLIPYAFQQTGMDNETFIAEWSKKVKDRAIYDYWSNTDWSYDQPTTSLLQKVGPRIRDWQAAGIQNVTLESTASAGSIGAPMWVASRMMWGDPRGPDELLAEFCVTAFGDAAEPMQRMLLRWHSKGYMASPQELALSFRDLEEAYALTDAPDVLARLDDMTRYVQYLRLWYEYRNVHRKTDGQLKAAFDLCDYLWRIHHTKMVHSYRLVHLMGWVQERPNHEKIFGAYPLRDRHHENWSRFKPVPPHEVRGYVAQGVADYRPVTYQHREFSDDLVPIVDVAPTPADVEEATALVSMTGMRGRHEFVFHAPPGMSRLQMAITAPRAAPEYPGTLMQLFDEHGELIHERRLPNDVKLHRFAIELPSPGRYRLSCYAQTIVRLHVPVALSIAQTSPLVSSSPSNRLFFYVPEGQQNVAMFVPSSLDVILEDSDRQRIDLGGHQKDFIVAEVPEGRDGEVWSIRNVAGHRPLRMLNLPQALSRTPHGVLAPSETLGPRND